MFKNDFDCGGLKFLCEHCRKLLATNFNFLTHTPDWVRVRSKRRDKGEGRGRILDFCDDKCRIIYLRGREYYRRKLKHMEENDKLMFRRLEGN